MQPAAPDLIMLYILQMYILLTWLRLDDKIHTQLGGF